MSQIKKEKKPKLKTVNITFKITPEMDEKLRKLAEQENRSRTRQIEYLITRRIEELERENQK